MSTSGSLFNTIYGRNLVNELPKFVHRPYLVITMEDLWPKFESCFDGNMAAVYFVRTLEHGRLVADVEALPNHNSVIGLGGGQALDVAKFISWTKRIPLFQVPTAMTTNAAFGHRAAIRFDGQVRYMGWAVPEAVYVDFDVIQGAPKILNRSGVGDVFCYHTAIFDWKLAHDHGKTRPQWPYDERLVAQSKAVLDRVIAHLDDVREVNEEGIRTLMEADCWGGAAFHNAGWNPRHIEGADHFLFYALEYLTRKPFIHGQPVCLGIYIGSALQDNEADTMLERIHRVGVDIRPEAMGVTWEDVARALYELPSFVERAGLWYTIVSHRPVTDAFIDAVRGRIEQVYGPWAG